MTAEQIDLSWIRRVAGVDLQERVDSLIRIRRQWRRDKDSRLRPMALKPRYCPKCGRRVNATTVRCYDCHSGSKVRYGANAERAPAPDPRRAVFFTED